MIALNPQPLLDGLVFPEGPRWQDGRLWFSDMHGHEVDAEGCVWLAMPGSPGGGFVRIAEGGEVKLRLDCGEWRGIACVLGGPQRRHLFLLEARRIQPSKIGGPGNGRIRVALVDVPGAGIP